MSALKPGARIRARSLLLFIAVLLFSEQPAPAYTDPGSGALLWQVVVAGLVGGLFYLRKMTAWFRGKDRKR